MENFFEKNTDNSTRDLHSNNFTEREATNEERWVNDVNEEFDEDLSLVNETGPDEDIPLEDDEDDFDEEMPLTDDELAGEVPIEESADDDMEDDDLFPGEDDELEDEDDDVEFK